MCGTFERLIIQTFSSYIISVNIIPTVLTVHLLLVSLALANVFKGSNLTKSQGHSSVVACLAPAVFRSH